MSQYKEAQDWLTRHEVYPGPGLANAIWSPERRHLAVVTRRWQVVLYQVDPVDVLWVAEADRLFVGMEFLGSQELVVRRHAEPDEAGASTSVSLLVERPEDGVDVRIVSLPDPCRTYGYSHTGRFQLIRLEGEGESALGMIDLGPWDGGEVGTHQVDVTPISIPDLGSKLGFCQVSPDGTRTTVRVGRKDQLQDHFFDLRSLDSLRSMPSYPWAVPSYLWSPDSRWIGAIIQETTPEDWDEIPVGGPRLKSFVTVYDGHSGERRWLEEVRSVHGPFEWTNSGALEAGGRVWDPSTGK